MIPRSIGKRFSNDWKRFWHDSGVFRSGQEQRQLEVTSMQNLQKKFSTFPASAQTLTGRKSFVIEVASAQDFGESTAKFSPRFRGHRFAFAQDDFWTSTRRPCGLTAAKLRAGSGEHRFSSPTTQIQSICRTTTYSAKLK